MLAETPPPFYRAFEDRFRGSEDTIRRRLTFYLPLVEPLKAFSSNPSVLDIGCGRGEWLNLMRETGFSGLGVDLDEAMLEAARERGLNVICADAIAIMRDSENDSYDIVSGFHIAEHLAFDDLRTVVGEALRILRPGGLLILETPNPENITVTGLNFHLDPTHVRPLPPSLLSFIAEHQGFETVRIVRLQEDPRLVEAPEATLHHVLTGISPDYALVAQKKGPSDIMTALQPLMDQNYGLQLEQLTDRFARTYARTAAMTESFNGVMGSVDDVNNSVENVKGAVETVRHLVEHEVHRHIEIIDRQQNMLDNALREADALRVQFTREKETLQERLTKLEHELETHKKSASWRFTRPLRAMRSLFNKGNA